MIQESRRKATYIRKLRDVLDWNIVEPWLYTERRMCYIEDKAFILLSEGHIHYIYTFPSHRMQGYASQLIRYVQTKALTVFCYDTISEILLTVNGFRRNAPDVHGVASMEWTPDEEYLSGKNVFMLKKQGVIVGIGSSGNVNIREEYREKGFESKLTEYINERSNLAGYGFVPTRINGE